MSGKQTQGIGIRGALVIQFGSKYANVVIQLIVTAILARLLTPTQYGTVAIVTVFTSFFSILADSGIAPAIIQFKDLSEDDLSGLFVFSVLFGCVLLLVFYFASYPIATVYGDPELVGLCHLASISILANAANMVPNGILLRDKRFLSTGIRLLVVTTISGLVAVFLAFRGFGAYSLVIQSVVLSVGVFVWSLLSSHLVVRNVRFMAPLKRILSYSLFQAGFTIVNYFSRNLDNMLIGAQLGTEALGYYDKAYKLTTYPISFLASIVGSVLQPYLSEYQDNKQVLCEKWLSIAKALSVIAAPIATIMVCAAGELVIIVFGDQWMQSVPLFQALAISVYFQVINNPTGAIFQSSGRTDYMFFHALVSTGITVLLLFAGLSTGSVTWAAIGISAAYCLHTVSLLYFLIHKTLSSNPFGFACHFLPELILAIAACFLNLYIFRYFSFDILVSLFLKILIILAIFCVGYYFTNQFAILKVLKKQS